MKVFFSFLLLLLVLSLTAIYHIHESRRMRNEIITLKEKCVNDSILVVEYQKSFEILMKSDKEAAMKFSVIMDSINTK